MVQPKILYKYMPPERIDFFDEPKLRFTPFYELNDPFEFQMAYCGVSSPAMKEVYAEYRRQKGDFTTPDVKEQSREELRDNMNEWYKKCNIGVLSLTESYDNLLMWAHYAVDHKGLVIGIDTEDRFFDIAEYSNTHGFIKVRYKEDRITGYSVDTEYGNDAFLNPYTKSYDWAYEQEWRYLAFCMNDFSMTVKGHDVYGLKEIYPTAIKEIYIGLNASEELKLKALGFAQRYSISHVYKMQMHATKYKIVRESL